MKKCERVDAHCHSVYAVKAHPQQADKLNSSRRAAAQDAGRSGGLKLDKRKCAVSGMKKTPSQTKFTVATVKKN